MCTKCCECHAKVGPCARSAVPAAQKQPGPSGVQARAGNRQRVKVLHLPCKSRPLCTKCCPYHAKAARAQRRRSDSLKRRGTGLLAWRTLHWILRMLLCCLLLNLVNLAMAGEPSSPGEASMAALRVLAETVVAKTDVETGNLDWKGRSEAVEVIALLASVTRTASTSVVSNSSPVSSGEV